MRRCFVACSFVLIVIVDVLQASDAAPGNRKGAAVFLSAALPRAVFYDPSRGNTLVEVPELPACEPVVVQRAAGKRAMRVVVAEASHVVYELAGDASRRLHARRDDCLEAIGTRPAVDVGFFGLVSRRGQEEILSYTIHERETGAANSSIPTLPPGWLKTGGDGPWEPEAGLAVYVSKDLTTTSADQTIKEGKHGKVATRSEAGVAPDPADPGSGLPPLDVVVSPACDTMLVVSVDKDRLAVRDMKTKAGFFQGADWRRFAHRTREECLEAVRQRRITKPPAD
jgi:hypothetical protein